MEMLVVLSILILAMLGLGLGTLLGRPLRSGCGGGECSEGSCAACPRRAAGQEGER